jgi:ribosome-associated toxin RatA of RatAB toxin-antitoxin module
MAQAQVTEILKASYDSLFKALSDYEQYPEFVEGCKTAVILEKNQVGEDVSAVVDYHVSMMKDIQYTLQQKSNLSAGKVEWSLKSSPDLKKNTGSYALKKVSSDTTEVTLTMDIEFNFSIPSFILSKLVKTSLPGMLRNFEKRAQKL